MSKKAKNVNKEMGALAQRRKNMPYYFLLPVLLPLVLLFGYPLLKSCVMAFQNYKLGNPDIYFNNFENFKKLFADKDFGLILKNSLIYVIVSVAGQFLLGLGLALALKKKFPGRGIYQSIVFLPWAFSAFVVGLLFRWSFNGEYGVVNDLLLKLGIVEKGPAWLGTPGLSLLVVIIAMIWIGIPFFGIMILAALQSIPNDVFEAADIDGCGIFRKFFSITVPYIKPTIIITVLLRTIWIFNSFDLIIIMTEGGPANYSQTLPSYIYTKAFSAYDFGLAGAFGLMLMIILGLYAAIFLKISKYEEAGDF